MKVTMKKIAQIANVSRGTVDKVLHNRPGVSDEVRRRVKKIADELGYNTNIIGKALACQHKPLVISIVIPKEENPFFVDVKRGIDAAYEEFKDFGLAIEYCPVDSNNLIHQVNTLQLIRDKKVSGVALRASDSPKIKDMVNKLVEDGTPVVTYDSDITGSRRMCFVGEDHIKSGRIAGELIGKLINACGKVAVVTGSNSILGHKQRVDGFKSFIKENYPEVEIVRTIETFEQEMIAFEKTIELLDDIEDLAGIFITDRCLGEVGKAVKIKGKNDKIIIVGFNFFPEIVRMVKDGVVDFTLGLDPYMQGFQTVKILFDYLFKGEYPKEDHFKTRIDIRVKENIDLCYY